MVAFFAPCCAGVTMPAYLAAIGGGHRFRVARLTAVYVAGVSLVVLPITLGAAALASYVSRWHPQMFTLGGLMMIGVAVALWRATVLPVNVPQPKLQARPYRCPGSASSPALRPRAGARARGAIALSATSGTIAGGLLLGIAYVSGMMAWLVPLALIYGRAKKRVRDPKVTLRLGSHGKRNGTARLVGVVVFASLGVLFVAGVDRRVGHGAGLPEGNGPLDAHRRFVLRRRAQLVSLPILLALVGGFLYAVLKKGSDSDERQDSESSPAVGARARAADHA
jgi:cytochrome c biogenesis protein CcdA